MAAKQSEEMKRAKALVLQGWSAYAAALECNISRSAIYMSSWYKEFKANGSIKN